MRLPLKTLASNNIILLGLAVFFTGEIWGMEQGCCESKTVGSNSYTLVENETASKDLGCNSLCVYKMDGKPESRYCFKSGDMPVNCTGDSRKIIIYNDLEQSRVTGNVSVKVFLTVAVIETIPYTIDESFGQVSVDIPQGSIPSIILKIAAADDEEEGIKITCESLLHPYGSVFAVIGNPPPSACKVINVDQAPEAGTCTAAPDAVGFPVLCLPGVNNCNSGFKPQFPEPAIEGPNGEYFCPCRCERDM